MRILVVDDDLVRQAELVKHIVEYGGISRESIQSVDCLDAARQCLQREHFSVLILDVVIPKRSRGRPDTALGIDVLRLISTSPVYHKPERIIGITAHLADLGRFKIEFDRYCLTVIEARRGQSSWKDIVLGAVLYMSTSTVVREVKGGKIGIFSIHGIQTFGGWQNRLAALARNALGISACYSYKYGVFSAFAFLIPSLRNREVIRLEGHLLTLFGSLAGMRLTIFAHSFGTYLMMRALESLAARDAVIPVDMLVLAGSVLPQKTDITFLRRLGIRLVNDCCDDDYVLYASQMAVLGMGMAGRSGFYGVSDGLTMNRFFTGSHSSYFAGDEFMNSYWLPLVGNKSEIKLSTSGLSRSLSTRLLTS